MRGMILLAVVAALVLTGFGAGWCAPTTSDAVQDQVFFSKLSDDPGVLTADRDKLVRFAHQLCDRFGNHGKRGVIERLVGGGMSLKRALKLAVAAAHAYCPEYLADLR